MKKIAKTISALMTYFLTMSAFADNPGNPAEELVSTGIQVLDPLQITQVRELKFGRIFAPTSGYAEYTMILGSQGGIASPATVSINIIGSGSYLDGAQAGFVTVNGTATVAGDPTVLVKSIVPPGWCTGSNDTVSLSSIVPQSSGTNILQYMTDVTGTIRVYPTASGSYSCNYSLTAEYD